MNTPADAPQPYRERQRAFQRGRDGRPLTYSYKGRRDPLYPAVRAVQGHGELTDASPGRAGLLGSSRQRALSGSGLRLPLYMRDFSHNSQV
jgi:hypothetical protein